MRSTRLAAARALAVLAAFAMPSRNATAQTAVHDPDRAPLVTSDIVNFWRAFDRAQQSPTAEARARIYVDTYIAPGTPGLHDWVHARLLSGEGLLDLLVAKGWSEERLRSGAALSDAERVRLQRDTSGVGDLLAGYNLDAAVRHRPRFFAAIRAATLAVDTAGAVTSEIRQAYHRLVDLYPQAAFPPVYFVMGQLSSGGTVTDAGQLIGMEMHARDSSTPVDELSPWEQRVVGRIDALPGIVAHELIHSEQRLARGSEPPRVESRATLLAQSLDEGCASFLGELISRGAIATADANSYGMLHEAALWREFQQEMNGTDTHRWLYQGDASKDRPADLGYFMGARICQAYYEHARDKPAAVLEILKMPDPAAFARSSGYAP